MSIQKQKDYYHARFHFSASPKEPFKAAADKLLQRCNHPHSSSQEQARKQPLRLFLVPQLMEHLEGTELKPTSIEFIEVNTLWGNKYPYYYVTFDIPRLVGTFVRHLPACVDVFTLHHHSKQFDEFYKFTGMHAGTVRSCNFWDRQSAMSEIFLRCRERKFCPIDYSTQLIPE